MTARSLLSTGTGTPEGAAGGLGRRSWPRRMSVAITLTAVVAIVVPGLTDPVSASPAEVAVATAGPAAGSTAVSGPVSHPQADHMGSTVAAHQSSHAGSSSQLRMQAVVGAAAVPAGTPGMDVSSYQGNVDWGSAVANGARFAYAKATEGTGYTNPYFAQQYNGSYDAGMIRGAYHFALPDRSSGAAQANYFVDDGGGWSGDGRTLPPVVDIEYNPYGAVCYGLTPAQMSSWLSDFATTVHARTTRWPVIYSTTDWWTTCTANDPGLSAQDPLWIASYNGGTNPGTLPAGWGYDTFWQYSDAGVYPGDEDVFNGSVDRLQALAGSSQAGSPPTPPSGPGTALAASGAPAPGEPVTLTATVTAANGAAASGGSVSFSAGGSMLGGCSAVGLSSGVARCVTTFGAAGPQSLVARYSGSASAPASTSAPATVVVAYGGPAASPVVAMAPTPTGRGYLLAASDGSVYVFGDAVFHGSMAGQRLNAPIVAMSVDPATGGYWLLGADGGVFSFGAPFFGSTGSIRLNAAAVGMEATPRGDGYRFVASDGGVFDFGPGATFSGSMGGSHLNQPVVGLADDQVTGGYWLVAADGGIFSFNAPFYGSTGNVRLNRPIVEMESLAAGNGYRFVASDGGVFDFGAARFSGSLGATTLTSPARGMASEPGGTGYWLVQANGQVTGFGGVATYGSA